MSSSDDVAQLQLALREARELLSHVRFDGYFEKLSPATKARITDYLNGPLMHDVRDVWLFRQPLEAGSQCRAVFSHSIASDLIHQRELKYTHGKYVGLTPPFFSREAPSLVYREDHDLNARIVKLFPPKVVKRIERLRQSKDGWDGKDAKALNEDSLTHMVKLFELFQEVPDDLGVFISPFGEAVVNWRRGAGDTVDLVFTPDEIEVATNDAFFTATLNDPQLLAVLFGDRSHEQNVTG